MVEKATRMSGGVSAALSSVTITADAYFVCLAHALTTEKEEVMGLLLGDTQVSETGQKSTHIWHVTSLKRSDKRKDRVEISPEALTDAITHCTELSSETGRNVRVIGWYHSHPHITVFPSHVDVNTQASYQALDECFVGLIFSCFGTNAHQSTNVQVIAFQSRDVTEVSSNVYNLDAALAQSMSPVRSTGALEQVIIPLSIVDSPLSEHTLSALDGMQRILVEEEREAFERAVDASSTGNGELPSTQLCHAAGVYTKALSTVAELIVGPTLAALEAREAENQKRIAELS